MKVAIESYLDMYRAQDVLDPVSIRAANPFGPRQGHQGIQGAIATFMGLVARGKPIEIWGDGSVVRDLADLCVAAGESTVAGALNAGSGKGRSINEIVDAISRVSGRTIVPDFKPARAIDVQRSVLDISRAQSLLGWRAETPFEVALQNTWEWVQAQRS